MVASSLGCDFAHLSLGGIADTVVGARE